LKHRLRQDISSRFNVKSQRRLQRRRKRASEGKGRQSKNCLKSFFRWGSSITRYNAKSQRGPCKEGTKELQKAKTQRNCKRGLHKAQRAAKVGAFFFWFEKLSLFKPLSIWQNYKFFCLRPKKIKAAFMPLFEARNIIPLLR